LHPDKKGHPSEIRLKPTSPQPFIAQPMRDAEGPRDPEEFRGFLNSIASRFPNVKRALVQSEMRFTPAGFVQACLANAAFIAALLCTITWAVMRSDELSPLFALALFPLYYAASFVYCMYYPVVRAKMRARDMDQELVFAGRHVLIELKSGIPIFDAMLGVTRDYGEVSVEFSKIVEKVTLGMPMGAALHEVAENNPSQFFRRVILQMANSLASGSDVADSLESSLDQISREQVIAIKAYGQKLNPLVMFYMIFGIIMPSLGVAFMIILSSFLGGTGLSFGSSALAGILVAVGLIQFVFLTTVESARPKFDIG
jgi:flagellar protein FlaJ